MPSIRPAVARILAHPTIREWVVPLLLVVAITTPLRAALADWYHVPSGSMRPTLLEGDRIFVLNCAYGLRIPMTDNWLARWDEPSRGDVVTLASPQNGTRLVKRVVGVPGDRLAVLGNRLVLNGRMLDYDVPADVRESLLGGNPVVITEHLPPGPDHAVTLSPRHSPYSTLAEVVVPDGHYFVMGDNRDNSFDSRGFGFVPVEAVRGRSTHVVVSVDPERFYLPRLTRFMVALG